MSASEDQHPHAALVLNPVKVDTKKLRGTLQALSKKHGWGPPRFYETSVADPGRQAASTAMTEGAAAVLAAGVSSTVRCVCQASGPTGITIA
jgi:hypothetical protein